MKIPFIINADLESLLEKRNICHKNQEKSSATKINNHTVSVCSLFAHCSFNATKNRLDYYRGKDCMKIFCNDFTFCNDFKDHATKIINYEKKKK